MALLHSTAGSLVISEGVNYLGKRCRKSGLSASLSHLSQTCLTSFAASAAVLRCKKMGLQPCLAYCLSDCPHFDRTKSACDS